MPRFLIISLALLCVYMTYWRGSCLFVLSKSVLKEGGGEGMTSEWTAIGRLVDLVHSRLPNYLALTDPRNTHHTNPTQNPESDTVTFDVLSRIRNNFNEAVREFWVHRLSGEEYTFDSETFSFDMHSEEVDAENGVWNFYLTPYYVKELATSYGLIDIFLHMFVIWSSRFTRIIQIETDAVADPSYTFLTDAMSAINEHSKSNIHQLTDGAGSEFTATWNRFDVIKCYTIGNNDADHVVFKQYDGVVWTDRFPQLSADFTGISNE